MEVVAHLNLSLSLMAFSNFNVLIKIADTEWTTLYLHSHKMSNFNRRPSIDDSYSYSVSVHLDKRFWRRTLKYEKLTDDGCQKLTFPLARWAKNLMQEEIFFKPDHSEATHTIFTICTHIEKKHSNFLNHLASVVRLSFSSIIKNHGSCRSP
jgi:hypothetical protein